jgi:UDP-N-acetylmuramyl pentapeptide phosphotransferase/UDP-N-acetylglucosamine-1-phosphate transferase
MTGTSLLFGWLVAALAAAIITYVTLALLIKTLRRHVTAEVNPRSSHLVETPEGAGIVVIPVALLTVVVAMYLLPIPPRFGMMYSAVVGGLTVVLTVVGFFDDARGLSVLSRLIVQFICVGVVVLMLPGSVRVLPGFIPEGVERALIIVGGVWFVNLVNFMDGIDLISVVETAAITLGIAILAWIDVIPYFYGWIAASLLGAVIGFAPWNLPPARLFLGDSGSVAVGFLLGVILLHVAASAGNAFVATVILPLYYLADATITLLRRIARGEKFWRAHRDHFYQQALRHGFSVGDTVWRIALLNLLLVVLAVASTYTDKIGATLLFAVASLAVAFTLYRFAHGRKV